MNRLLRSPILPIALVVAVHLAIQGCSVEPALDTANVEEFAGIEFVWIPPGTFEMGSALRPEETQKRYGGMAALYRNEHPQHSVTITKGFWMSRYEVTRAQWESVTSNNPSQFKGPGRPVDSVMWVDCHEYLDSLNRTTGESFRLPTEAEWEYACRVGTTTEFYFGDSISRLKDYAWYKDNSNGETHPVGLKKPNGWGLHDMYGNVSEWCQDYADNGYYANSPREDPKGPASGTDRIYRGGNWEGLVSWCRSAWRFGASPNYQGTAASRCGMRLCTD